MQDSDSEVGQEVEIHEDTPCNAYEGIELLVLFDRLLLPVLYRTKTEIHGRNSGCIRERTLH